MRILSPFKKVKILVPYCTGTFCLIYSPWHVFQSILQIVPNYGYEAA